MTYTVIPWHRERENHVLGRETCGFHPLILVSCNLLCSHKREREFWSCVNQLCWRERTILVLCKLALQERERKSCMNQLCRREKDFGRVNQICRRENKILVLCELALQEREGGERNFGQLYRLELRERGREWKTNVPVGKVGSTLTFWSHVFLILNQENQRQHPSRKIIRKKRERGKQQYQIIK